jgi:tetratricopeptide (TPR) repeat protein
MPYALLCHVRDASRVDDISPRFIPQEPNAPQIFFGRESELSQIVHMVFSGIASRPARIAILGPGGYGKTTLVNAVLTHDRIREHFGDARYFVTCESTASSEALLIELGKTLGILDGAPNALWSRVRTALSARESILCLDNFESPWDQSSDIKHSVEELLSRITVLDHVTILVTMRGVERPARTYWSQPFLEPLGTFGQDAAEQVWQAIAGNYDEYAEKLIAAVDYVPLAVDLLAHLSQMIKPMMLWEEWNSKWTKVVQRGQMHRLSNLDYSIQLSIDSARMKANPSSKNLLGVLSMLPDGFHMKQLEQYQKILADMDIMSCLWTLQQCGLIKLTDERYQLHPIVRHFCKNQEMLPPVHRAIVEDFSITLASLSYQSSPRNYAVMVSEVNNIEAVLLALLESNYKNQSKLINACCNFVNFQNDTGNHSDKVISQVVQLIQKSNDAEKHLVACLTLWGRVYYEGRAFEQAYTKLKEAETSCKSNFGVNDQLYGDVLFWLGNTYWIQDKLNDAMACYQKALKISQEMHNIFQEAYVLDALGVIYIRLGRLDDAFTTH